MKPHAFPKSARLLRRREFDRVFKTGRLAKDGDLVIHMLPNDRAQSRIGIVIGKKVKRAVDRNRIKRWVREAFRLHPEAVPSRTDLVVVPRNPFALTWERVLRSFLRLVGPRLRPAAPKEPS